MRKITHAPVSAEAIEQDRDKLAEFYDGPAAQLHRQRPPYYEPFPMNTFRQVVGARNRFVIARRSPNIIARYGADVVCLSQQRYAEAERIARLLLTEGFD